MASRPRIRRALDWVDSPAGGSTPWNMDALDDRDISGVGKFDACTRSCVFLSQPFDVSGVFRWCGGAFHMLFPRTQTFDPIREVGLPSSGSQIDCEPLAGFLSGKDVSIRLGPGGPKSSSYR